MIAHYLIHLMGPKLSDDIVTILSQLHTLMS